MTDISAALAQAKLPERSVLVCLRGDLVAQFEAVERDLDAVDRPAVILAEPSLADGSRRHNLASQLEALRTEMQSSTVEFRLRALPRRPWAELVAAWPAREGNAGDKALGINEEGFFAALLRVCTVEPELSPEQWDHLLDAVLTDGQYQQLTGAAWAVNRHGVQVPFSPAASTILRNSGIA